MTRDEIQDAICEVTAFMNGYGDVTGIACERLRRLMDRMDAEGIEMALPVSIEGADDQ